MRAPTSRCPVERVFPVREGRKVICQLSDEGWRFTSFGPVLLHVGELIIDLDYRARGNVEGQPTIELHLAPDSALTADQVMSLLEQARGDAWVELLSPP